MSTEINGSTSDGYHTFDELYEHRVVLFIALCEKLYYNGGATRVWRSYFHSDGSTMDGWFVLGIDKEKGRQITYHLPIHKWKDTDLFHTLERAPYWDGHTSADVLERLKKL